MNSSHSSTSYHIVRLFLNLPVSFQDEERVSKENPRARYIGVNQEQNVLEPGPKFDGNGISTAKYNVATFLPLFLFEMFSRVAYLYFLIQVGSFLALVFVLCRQISDTYCADLSRTLVGAIGPFVMI